MDLAFRVFVEISQSAPRIDFRADFKFDIQRFGLSVRFLVKTIWSSFLICFFEKFIFGLVFSVTQIESKE